MVLRTFNFWGFCSLNWKPPDFNDLFWKNTLKSMVLQGFARTFKLGGGWPIGGGGCGPSRDFLYYYIATRIFDMQRIDHYSAQVLKFLFNLKQFFRSVQY